MTDLDAAPVVGTHLGRYLFLREIATGPFGPLYELRSDEEAGGLSGLGRVINLSAELDPQVEEAIVASAWDSLELRHEHALCVADVVFGKGWVTLVHDYSEGSLLETLRARARERSSTFPVAVALRIITDVIEGLEHNRKVCESAGIAWCPGGTNASSLYLCGDGRTRSLDGQLVVTLLRTDRAHSGIRGELFSAPEVVRAGSEIDERADVFAAGAVLWQLLTGSELKGAVPKSATPGSRVPVPKLNLAAPKDAPKFPAAMARVVDSALEHDPAKRPATLAAFKSALLRDLQVASYAQVIDFTDALLHRESTLFRLALDPEPRLSDELRMNKALPAHHEWALELAKKARLAADAPRPAVTTPPQHASAAIPRVKAPSLSFPAVRTESAAQPKKAASPLHHQPTQRAPSKPLHRTLLGISPAATSGHIATALASAAPVRVELQPATIAEAISEVQPVAPPEVVAPVIELTSESTSDPKGVAATVPTDALDQPASAQRMTEQAARLAPPAEALPALTPAAEPTGTRHTAAAAEQDSSVDDTFIRRKSVVQLSPLALAGGSMAMVCVTALATLALQRAFAGTSIPQSPLTVVSAAASRLPTISSTPVEISDLAQPSETDLPAQHATTSEPGARVAEPSLAADRARVAQQPAIPDASSQTQLTGKPSAKVAASAAPAAPKQYPRTPKRRYIPRGL